MRYCPACLAEFATSASTCSDCGGGLVDGTSPRYDGRRPRRVVDVIAARGALAPNDEMTTSDLWRDASAEAQATAADLKRLPSDFVPLVTLRDGSYAIGLWGMLEEAGITTLNAGPRHTQLRAPGSEPVGEDLWGAPMRVGVLREDLKRAKAVLAEWPEQYAIIEYGDPQAVRDAPASQPALSSSIARALARARTEPDTDWLALALIAALVGVLLLLGAQLLLSR